MNDPTPTDTKPPVTKRTPLNQRLGFWLTILAVIIIVSILAPKRLNKNNTDALKQKAPMVVVTVAKLQDVPVYLSALGSVTPTYSVTVMTQINGTLLKVLFREGQMVKKNDLLAQIDDAPYQAQLVEYKGQLLRDQALLTNALIDLKRYQTLWKQDSVAQQTLATQQALVKQYQGAVQLDQGLVDVTNVNIAYCKIISPVDGRIGLRLVDPGNYVQTSNTSGIAIVNTLNPITAIFTIPEDNIPDVRQRIYAGETFTVEAYNREQTKKLAVGTVLTIDNQIDPNTGTVRLKAQFANQDNALFPSQFINIKLLLTTLKNAIVVPTAAVQFSAKGSFVYVLNTNQTVSVRPVKTGVTSEGITTITSGIIAGNSVVTEGADTLTNGSKVTLMSPNKAKTNVLAQLSRQVLSMLAQRSNDGVQRKIA